MCCRDIHRDDTSERGTRSDPSIRLDSSWAEKPIEGVAIEKEDRSVEDDALVIGENPGTLGMLDVRGILDGPSPIPGKASVGTRIEPRLIHDGHDLEQP